MPHQDTAEAIHWFSRTLAAPNNPTRLRQAVAARPGAVILESAAVDGKWGRCSIYAFDPLRTITAADLESPSPFDQLARCCRPWPRLEPPPRLPFVGGWIGHLSYEAGHFVEPTGGFGKARLREGEAPQQPEPIRWLSRSFALPPNRQANLPIARWALFDTALIHDAVEDSWTAVAVDLPARLGGNDRPPAASRLDDMEALVLRCDESPGQACPGRLHEMGRDLPPHEPHELRPRGAMPVRWNFSRDAYLARVERVLDYIRAGDIFQVNLARQCRVAVTAGPFEIYERLRAANPSIYAAYVPLALNSRGAAHTAILSSSPELFLSVADGVVITRPIKGTRPRGRTPLEDAAAARALAASEKDRAELNMIIDLERNDLGRVCEFGTVRVLSDGDIEKLPTVFHRTAMITGRLRDDADAVDLLRAAFPGGSITGAPKVRAMQIINELEPTPRGPYCGAIGWIRLDGDMTLNLAIRTMVVADGRADVMVGSGIVADSDPEAEYEELEAKAAGMFAALRIAEQPEEYEALCLAASQRRASFP